jgi:hypothetical protein
MIIYINEIENFVLMLAAKQIKTVHGKTDWNDYSISITKTVVKGIGNTSITRPEISALNKLLIYSKSYLAKLQESAVNGCSIENSIESDLYAIAAAKKTIQVIENLVKKTQK